MVHIAMVRNFLIAITLQIADWQAYIKTLMTYLFQKLLMYNIES